MEDQLGVLMVRFRAMPLSDVQPRPQVYSWQMETARAVLGP